LTARTLGTSMSLKRHGDNTWFAPPVSGIAPPPVLGWIKALWNPRKPL
jgi:hypothetical protein